MESFEPGFSKDGTVQTNHFCVLGLLGSSASAGVVPIPFHMQHKPTPMIGLLPPIGVESPSLKHTRFCRFLRDSWYAWLQLVSIGKGPNSRDRKKDEYLSSLGVLVVVYLTSSILDKSIHSAG